MLSRIVTPLLRHSYAPKAIANALVAAPVFRFSQQNYVARPLLPRTQAPAWAGPAVLPDGTIKGISSTDYKGKYTVLLFYPLDFTFVCPTELYAFGDAQAQFDKLNAQVIGVSIDSQFSHLAWRNLPRKEGGLGQLGIPLLADHSKRVSKAFGVLVDDQNDPLYGVALRGVFIIDDKNVVRSVTVNDAPVGRSVDEVLRVIQAFQYTDKHGEVCPAGWKPGDATIDPKDKSKYFGKKN